MANVMSGGLVHGYNDMRCSACGGRIGWFGAVEQHKQTKRKQK